MQTRLQPFLLQHPDPPFSHYYMDLCERTYSMEDVANLCYFLGEMTKMSYNSTARQHTPARLQKPAWCKPTKSTQTPPECRWTAAGMVWSSPGEVWDRSYREEGPAPSWRRQTPGHVDRWGLFTLPRFSVVIRN